jgi:tRNA pseudouridine55 synthase
MQKINGWINIYKPKNCSSAKIVHIARKALSIQKIGHTGTLDPLAEGVLPIAVGEATKLCSLLIDSVKQYEFTISFGKQTSSGDLDGEVINSSPKLVQEGEIERVIPRFIGKINQIPPKYSAIKINGKRAYKMARENLEFEMPSRQIEIFDLKLMEFDQNLQTAKLLCTCSKGTYIRTLAEDIAFALQNFGFVIGLRRLKCGVFDESSSFKICVDEFPIGSDALVANILPTDFVLDDILVIDSLKEEAEKIRFGQIVSFDVKDSNTVAIKSESKLIAIGSIKDRIFKSTRVFNL